MLSDERKREAASVLTHQSGGVESGAASVFSARHDTTSTGRRQTGALDPTEHETAAYAEQWRAARQGDAIPWLSDQDLGAIRRGIERDQLPPSIAPWWETTPGAHMAIADLHAAGAVIDALMHFVVPDATISPGQVARYEHRDLAHMSAFRLWQERERVKQCLVWVDEILPEHTWLEERWQRIATEEQRRGKAAA